MRIQICCFLSSLSLIASAQTFEVGVHPGQELLTIIQILADQYPEPNESTYQKDMRAHFANMSDHPAVRYIAAFQNTLYTDFPEMGWCIETENDYALFLPDSNSWYELYGKDTVQQYLRLAVDFAKASDFKAFYNAHEPDYASWGIALSQKIDSLDLVSKLDQFHRIEAEPHFYIAMDPLNSWGAHAIPHLEELNPNLSHVKAYSLGYWNRASTSSDDPSFTSTSFLTDLVWHEGSHIYLNQVLLENEEQIAQLEYLYDPESNRLRRQNINDWAYCFEENLVRGIVISLIGRYSTPLSRRYQNAEELSAGFIYAEFISHWIDEKYLGDTSFRPWNYWLPILLSDLKNEFPTRPE
ncbi:MAG: DUF4932 domain-containing protein [Bacteroidota bacterium]